MNEGAMRNSVLAALAEVGRYFSDKLSAKVASMDIPQDIREAISVDPPKSEGERSFIDVLINLAIAPAAGAYEYGSGIHSERGTKAEYPIRPVEKQALAFYWEKAEGGNFVFLPDGRVIFREVSHPGVGARPYIRPTIEEEKAQIKRILGKAFTTEVMRGVKVLDTIIV